MKAVRLKLLILLAFSLLIWSCGNRAGEELRRAAIKGDAARVKILLTNGANADYRHGGWTVLMFAVKEGHADIVRQLLDSGADPNARSKSQDGGTPLTIAAEHGHLEIAELLLNKGANVNGRNAHGNTALMYAAEYNYPEVTLLLLKAGADITLKDNDGETALLIAQRKNYSQILSLLNGSRNKAQ